MAADVLTEVETARERARPALLVWLMTAVWVNLNTISPRRYDRDRLMGWCLADQENVDRQKTGPAKQADKGRLSDRWNPDSETSLASLVRLAPAR